MPKSSEPKKISLIITTYHKDADMAKLTERCLQSLATAKNDAELREVIVVDDASPYQTKFPGSHLTVRRAKNGGFPEAANTGWKNATGDTLILSNNDLVYSDGWLDGLLEPLKQGYDISSVRMSDSDGTATENIITEDDWFGSLWAMKREVYDTIGGFDERFIGGTWEDKDYWVRARDAGFRIGKNHAVVVEHIGRATMDTVFPNQEDFHENAQRFKDKYGYLL